MGLDISAFRQLRRINNPELDADENPVDYEIAWKAGAGMEWSEKTWPGRCEGVEFGAVYSWGDRFGFHAGSYSGYNWWRDQLAQMAGHAGARAVLDDRPSGPFVELINFADNDGVIGSVVAAKLAQDFRDHLSKALTWAARMPGRRENGNYFLESYRHWLRACEMAADGGAIEFH